MEDAATAEISRAQLWQWRHHGVTLTDGRRVTADLIRILVDEELAGLRKSLGEEAYRAGRWAQARSLFAGVALAEPLVEFLTLPAYEFLT
jgi:malate synthase